MKTKTAAVFSIAVGAILYVAYFWSGVDSLSGLWEWLQSLVTRVSLKLSSVVGDIVPTDDQTQAVAIALDFIASKEGFSSKAYPDPAGQSAKWSIGYGHQIVPGDGYSTSSRISESQARAQLDSDVQRFVDCVYSAIQITPTPNMAAALISLCYNIGCSAFTNSTLVRLLNSGDLNGATAAFGSWIYSGGQVNDALVARRQDEATLFQA